MKLTHREEEIDTLERCATEARARMEAYREQGDQLQADLTESDLNGILEKLSELYERRHLAEGASCTD